MSIGVGTGVGVTFGGSINWSSWWKTQNEVLFFAETKDIADGKLYNKKKGATDYLTVAGSAGSYTFQCPNTAAYIAADTDYIWFKTNAAQRTTTEAELIGYDLQKTPVKYDDDEPNAIIAIMILSSAVTGAKRDKMFRDMRLQPYWDNSANDNGFIKSNRTLYTQTLWTPESVLRYSDTFTDTDEVELIDHTPDIGEFTWIDSTSNPASWEIISNKALINFTNTNFRDVYFDTGDADVDMFVDLTVPDSAYICGFVVRRESSSNTWRVLLRRVIDANAFVKIYKGATAVHEVDTGSHTAGTKTLRVVVDGNYFTVYLDGVKLIDAYESDGSYNTNKNYGLAGIYGSTYTVQTKYDNFKIV